jgi:trehalose/maltose hydrolase-like predicted phosphorylase
VTPTHAVDRTGETIPILTGALEEHVTAGVAWAASHYVDWSGDTGFAQGQGRELLVETARYWASRIEVADDGSAHIRRVTGPDEYHECVDDDAYTNVMARWNLRAAAAAGGTPSERARWRRLANALVDGYDPSTGLYEQFAGFFALEPLVIADLAARRPIAADLLLGRERVAAAQVIKQADVLMAHLLVPDEVAPGSLEVNLAHYEPLTAHGSSLSPGVHAALLARAGRADEAVALLRLASRIDLDDLTGTTAGGLHIAAMGSVWLALAYGFAGLRARRGALEIDPALPRSWDGLDLRVTHRGSPLRIELRHGAVRIEAAREARVRVGGGRARRVAGTCRLVERTGRWHEVRP